MSPSERMPPVVENPLFFLDYDGTLAPIVDEPGGAVPHPRAPDLLRRLDDRYPLWIVTGRDVQGLSSFLDRPYQAIGLHGAQQGIVGEQVEHLMSDETVRALRQLRESVPRREGVRVEEKDRTFAVHYRQVEDKEEMRAQLEQWLEGTPDVLEAIWGKAVVELRPKGLTKGTAVRRIADEHPDRTPIYLGDDVTDEDAFRALQALDRRTVTVKVGVGETTAAHRLSDPEEVMDYLEEYL